MRGIILAAGRGSRMGTKTESHPKCLTELWDKTLLEWQVQSMRAGGVDELAIVTGYMSEKITLDFEKRYHNENWSQTNMFASLMCAEEWLQERCIISYSDIVYKKEAVEMLVSCNDPIAMTYYTDFLSLWQKRFEDPLKDLETFRVDEYGNLLEIGLHAKSVEEIQGQFMGLIGITLEGFDAIKKAMKDNPPKPPEKIDMTSMLNHLIAKGVNIAALPYDKLWLEVDNQKDLELYQSMYQKKDNL